VKSFPFLYWTTGVDKISRTLFQQIRKRYYKLIRQCKIDLSKICAMTLRKSVILVLAGLLFALSLNGATRKPNVVLIMVDDASWECFGPYGAVDYQTPHIDKLAKQGLQFDHCYSTPICTTSRVKLMTGQYNFRNYTNFGYLNPRDKTFGHLLQDAGYKTAIAGKWQLNGLHHEAPDCYDSTRPMKAGFHESLLWQVTKGKGEKDGGGERYWNAPLEHNGVLISRETNWGKYGPDLFTDFICDFMERNKNDPFFVYYPMVLVHDVFVPTPDTLGDTPLEVANKMPKDPQLMKKHFVAMVNYMDKLVGRIVHQVESLGLAEDTIILLTADNGTDTKITSLWNSIELPGGKGGTTDRGTHVPFIAYWKGHTPSGVISKDLIDFTDFYPTLAEAAGVEMTPEDPIDGISFFAQLNGKSGTKRVWQLSHYQPYWGPLPGQYVRDRDYKLYRDGRLIHVSEDLFEETDISDTADGKAASAKETLSSILMQLPEVIPGKGDRREVLRPVYPGIPNILESAK
jgi:arylsulfatase A